MANRSIALERGSVGWYLPSDLEPASCKDAVVTAPFVVAKGKAGIAQLRELRLGAEVSVFVDPAQNEAKKALAGRVDRHGWESRQEAAGVIGLVSPGAYLYRGMSSRDVRAALEVERQWVACAGGTGYVAVNVDAHFLRDRVPELAGYLADEPRVWLTLSHANDPLALRGAVEALAQLVLVCPGVALMRTDLAGLGAVAFGAPLAAIGLSGGTRHAPHGGGGARNDVPVVFAPTLLSFRKTNLLEGWMQRDPDIDHDLRCLQWCCEGESILRYADPALRSEAMLHNMVGLRAVIGEVMELDADRRARKFVSMARHAWFQHERLRDSIDAITVPPQIEQWANLLS